MTGEQIKVARSGMKGKCKASSGQVKNNTEGVREGGNVSEEQDRETE